MISPEQFAKEFLNDVKEDLEREPEHTYFFNQTIYDDDPNLNLIKQQLKTIGYTLVLKEPKDDPIQQDWILTKL